MVDVGDDGDIADVLSLLHGGLAFSAWTCDGRQDDGPRNYTTTTLFRPRLPGPPARPTGLGRAVEWTYDEPMRRAAMLALVLTAMPAALRGQATVQMLPGHPSSADALEFVIDGSPAVCWPASLLLDPPVLERETLQLPARTPPGPLPPGCSPGWPQRFTRGPLPAGSYSAEFLLDGVRQGAVAFEVLAPPAVLELQGGTLAVRARFVDPRTGREGAAQALPLTDWSGSFWFFSPGNIELTVKILDGRALNGAYWIFIASMTTVAYAVEVERRDPICAAPCETRTYSSPADTNRNFIDTRLFPQ